MHFRLPSHGNSKTITKRGPPNIGRLFSLPTPNDSQAIREGFVVRLRCYIYLGSGKRCTEVMRVYAGMHGRASTIFNVTWTDERPCAVEVFRRILYLRVIFLSNCCYRMSCHRISAI